MTLPQRRSYGPARPCEYCGAIFRPRKDGLKRGQARFCSKLCGCKNRTKPITVPVEEVVKLYEGGMTIMEVADKIGANCKAVHRALHTNGAHVRQGGRRPIPNYTGYPHKGRGALHTIIARETIGRALRKGELVHHVNGDKRDNTPSNLVVLPSNKAHYRAHHSLECAGFELVKRGLVAFKDGVYVVQPMPEVCKGGVS